MYHHSDPSYLQARAIKKGELKLSTIHEEMVNWISREFNVRALDYYYDAKPVTPSYREQIIRIILETTADCTKIETPENKALIATRFITFLRNFNPHVESDPLKKDAFPSNTDPIPQTIISFHALETIEWNVAWRKAEKEAVSLKNQFDFVWDIDVGSSDYQIIFFFTNSQFTEINCATALNALLAILKKYDAFGYFGLHSFSQTTRFDSKENFDTNYDGEAWKYYR